MEISILNPETSEMDRAEFGGEEDGFSLGRIVPISHSRDYEIIFL